MTHSSSRGAARLALVTNPPPAASDAPTGVPAGLRLLRSLDRSVLEVAREVELRPMELYALLLLSDAPDGETVTTRTLAGLLAASPSQAKQIALRLSARGLVDRAGAQGRTSLTPEGRKLAATATAVLGHEIDRRLGEIDSDAVEDGAAALAGIVARG